MEKPRVTDEGWYGFGICSVCGSDLVDKEICEICDPVAICTSGCVCGEATVLVLDEGELNGYPLEDLLKCGMCGFERRTNEKADALIKEHGWLGCIVWAEENPYDSLMGTALSVADKWMEDLKNRTE